MKPIAILLALALAIGGWFVRPRSLELAEPRTGDAALQQYIDDHYEGAGHRLAVALVDGDSVRFAGRGADEHAAFETGSISKAFTGLLLSEAIRRGEVKLDQQVGSLLPLHESEVATATLEDLATHHAGLPSTPRQPLSAARSFFANLMAGNPYPYDVDQLLDHARSSGRGDEPRYSNLGGALLGQALARSAGQTYPELLSERVLEPLGLTETRTPVDEAGAAPPGYSSGGRKQDPWVQVGYAPAGGVVSSTRDLSKLAQSLLAGRSVDALAPRREFDGERIGMFWLTSPLGGTGRNMVWHNGGTGGYRSFLGLDLERRRAVVVLSDVAVDVDDFAEKLLEEPV
ncbi:CubicO group peptidase (beta-lactamase class C family) [Kribbella amoyensis]|uniref:CubicO group peptidase (Beta-lactamase class C family) n=1 Tax=Kribbella amoyensis TaxID=996641 RepID=A0A561BR79_9ACTN|nr:serine hydrolase domain-containing protein [Kribbella amoyensis]TWD81408.1 CubicO group peptidase (beta-lactamase class C family) [Kribbella amoyensis]